MSARTLPSLWDLTREEREGRLCIQCGTSLGKDAKQAGIAVGYWGAHNRSVAVYQCPNCSPDQ